MRDECFRNQPMFVFRKSIFFKKIIGKLGWIFFTGKHPPNGEERKNSLTATTVTTSRNGADLILNESETLIQKLKIDLKNRLVGSICPYTWIDPEIGEQKPCTNNISLSFLYSFKDEKIGLIHIQSPHTRLHTLTF